MSRKIIGVTVGTPISPARVERHLKPVKSVNGVAPDESGNVEVCTALVGSATGEIVSLSDVSPIEHEMGVKVRGKNLIPYPYENTTKTTGGVTYTDNKDGTITIDGTATAYSQFNLNNVSLINNMPCTLFFDGYAKNILLVVAIKNANNETIYNQTITAGLSYTINNADAVSALIYIKRNNDNSACSGVIKPMISLGTTATAYTPYVEDISAVKVKKYGENQPIEYPVSADGTVEGVTSLYPVTTLMTDTAGAVIDCTYNRDANKVITDLEAKLNTLIATIGG